MMHRRVAVLFVLAFTLTASAQVELKPRPNAIKPANTVLREWHEPSQICVKFNDDEALALNGASLDDSETGRLDALREAFAPFAGGVWSRQYDIDDAKLSAYRAKAQASLGKQVADLSTYYHYQLPAGINAARAIDALNTLDIIELAQPIPKPSPPPVPGSFVNSQVYGNDPPNGTDAFDSWSLFGFRGEGVRVCDVEYGFNPNHQDLPVVPFIGGPGINPFDDEHGTAVLGIVGSLDNGFGTTGLAPDAELFFSAALVGTYNPGAAIIRALDVLEAGDVIIIEQQITGPNGGSNFVPIEWFASYYNSIVTAVGNGIVIVEAAGNGGQNLDAPEFQTGNGGHYPFLPENDSGAIIVGAGGSSFSATPRTRLGFSTYGQTVDLQGWGQNVTTTGYGGLYSAEGPDLWYTSSFNGTSSASPIVASAVALLQSAYQNLTGLPLTPIETRDILRATGSPQTGNSAQNIGPLPNVPEAINLALGDAEALLPIVDDFEMPTINTLNWTTSIDASITTEASNEPSGSNSLKLLSATGQLLSARLQGRLFDDITISYAYQLTGTSELVVEWFETTLGFIEIARHPGDGTAMTDFATASVALPLEASLDGLRVRFRSDTGSGDCFIDDVLVAGLPARPRPFELVLPIDGATDHPRDPNFDWTDSELQESYRLLVDDNEDFSSPELDFTTIISGFSNPAQIFEKGSLYYWKVEAQNINGTTLASNGVRTFSTVAAETVCQGDCSNNGVVSFDDLVCILFRFGQFGHDARIDCDTNGDVDFNDLICVLFAFGPCE